MAIAGAVLGDILGSSYEFKKDPKYLGGDILTPRSRFTDDTVLSIAIKYAILHKISFDEALRKIGNEYIDVGYGGMFKKWLQDETLGPYESYGNGSAMRVSYIGECFDSLEDVMKWADKSAMPTHNSDEGIKGAVVTASCIWMAKNGYTKDEILNYACKEYPNSDYEYSCEKTLDELRSIHKWNATCQGSVPVAIRAVYEADTYEQFIKNVLSIRCDTDTLCAIGGGIAEELYGFGDIKADKIIAEKLPLNLYKMLMER